MTFPAPVADEQRGIIRVVVVVVVVVVAVFLTFSFFGKIYIK